MKSLLSFIVLAVLLLMVGFGCATAQTTICEFDKDGKITKKTVTGERDAIDKITASTKNKTVIAWTDGWLAYLVVSIATPENPTPTAKMGAGKVAKGLITILPGQQNVAEIAKIIEATKTTLTVSTKGINSTGTPPKEKITDN